MNELPPNWLHQTLESTKAMNAQYQIKLLAEKAQANACEERHVSHDCELGRLVFKHVLAALTAQQTAAAAAHRDLKREHNETLDVLLSLRNSCDDALYQRDTARAESEKLREVLGVAMESLSHYRKGDDHAAGEEVIAAAAHFEEGDKLRTEALALAATVLKEDLKA